MLYGQVRKSQMRKIKNLNKSPYPAPDVQVKYISTPYSGWDAISPLSAMKPEYAAILINWIPRTGWVELRNGYAPWAQMITTGPVESLMCYRAQSSTETLFAASGGKIFDVSLELQNSYSAVVTGLTNNRWQYTNFTPAGAPTVLQCVNGEDAMHQWNGTSWTTPSITGLPGSHTTADFINIAIFKRRIFYILKGTSIAVFMPTDAISGPISGYLDVGAFFKKGGYLVALAGWTIDGGTGPDDYLALVSSQGEVVVYQGVDPTDSTQWALVGVFAIAKPLGYRCMTSIGSDVAIITLMGVIPISQALPFDPAADRSVAITSRIQNAMATAAQAGQNLFGWQLITFPAESLLFLNVPQIENQTQVQYVSDLLNGAWCQFQGWNANCFELCNQLLFWGDNNGNVNQAFVGGSDFNSAIQYDMQCAFNYFDEPGRHKRMTFIEPLMVTSGDIRPTLGVDTDFQTSNIQAPVTPVLNVANAQWDSAIWDQSLWGGPLTAGVSVFYSTQVIPAQAMAIRMKVNLAPTIANGTFDFGQFDVMTFDATTSPNSDLQVNGFNAVIELGGIV